MSVSLLFFHNIGPNLAQFMPQDHTHIGLSAGFQGIMLKDSINFSCNWNPVVLKKNVQKPLKITIFWSNFQNNGVSMGHAQNEKQIFFRNNKAR